MKLTDLQQAFSAQMRKKATAQPLREVEEIEKDQWEAFADDGNESYVIQIVLEKSEVVRHTCDCGKYDAYKFCVHQIALLLHLANGVSGKAVLLPKGQNTKEDPLHTMLGQIEKADLVHWIKEILNVHKDLQVAFMARFEPKPDNYTVKNVQEITNAAVISVIKTKKKIDQTELKQILNLWKQVHQPIIDYYLSFINTTEKIEILSALLDVVDEWRIKLNVNTTKFKTYLGAIFAKTIEPLHNIAIESIWEATITKYFQTGFKNKNDLAIDWLTFLGKITQIEPNQQRVDFILMLFKDAYIRSTSKKSSVVNSWFTELVYDIYKKANKTTECILWIKPILHENEFNMEVIDQLITQNYIDLAEQHCLLAISNNQYEAYNVSYLHRLKNIYLLQQPAKREELFTVIREIFPYYSTLDDYLLILNEHFKGRDAEAKKWRTKVMNKMSNYISRERSITVLYFEILYHEGKFGKILQNLIICETAEIACMYFDTLYILSRIQLLRNLAMFGSYYMKEEADKKRFLELAEKIKSNYSTQEIKNNLLKENAYKHTAFVTFCRAYFAK